MTQRKFKLITENANITSELENTVRSFTPYALLDSNGEELRVEWIINCVTKNLIHVADNVGNTKNIEIRTDVILNENNVFSHTYAVNMLDRQMNDNSAICKKHAKLALYDALVEILNISLPYGSLTGIRPTKLFYELQESRYNAKAILIDEYKVSDAKADLIVKTVQNQGGIYKCGGDKIDLFINIPICRTRCSYCSFASIERGKLPKAKVSSYASAIRRELEQFYEIFSPSDIRSIYIGGGTPTVLTLEELKIFLPLIRSNNVEFTVEAGRPDTIDEDKLKLFRDLGVTRVSINPQSLNQKTIDNIGRGHTVADFYDKYAMATALGFDVNADLIAMLPKESFEDFAYSLDKVIDLQPSNITVHSLSIKKGSSLILEGYENTDGKLANKMIDHSISKLSESGYNPYYMYRLKNISGGLENVGYAKPNKQCVYNIDIMEETHSVYAIGAGGISKRVTGDNIEREAASKDIYYYLENFDSQLERKRQFFDREYHK